MMRDVLRPLRIIHGHMYDELLKLKPWKEVYDLEKKGVRLSADVGTYDALTNNDEPIDFVVTWVDGADKAWLAERNHYLQAEYGISVEEDNGEERYRDWDIFHFWFRSVEQYAPWVRNVYLVTWGHVPQWLKVDAPKLKIIKHEDFIPKEYLPVFSTIPIELNLHRIPGLSEHFVYFNDDMFLNCPVQPEDFFHGGLPLYTAVSEPLRNKNNDAFDHMQYATIGLINKVFRGKLKDTIKRAPEKWFASCYGDSRKWNRLSFDADFLLGMCFPHLGVPCRKSTMQKVWDHVPNELDVTCKNRFRTPKDIIHQIFSLWEMMEGSFYPVNRSYHGKHFWNVPQQIDIVVDSIKNKDSRMICINDSQIISKEDFEYSKEILLAAFTEAFPQKSSFEK